MKRSISAVEARKRLGELLEEVFYRGDEIVIERAGKAMAVVIPAERYAALERQRERAFQFIERAQARNREVAASEVEAEVAAALREVRAHAAEEPRPLPAPPVLRVAEGPPAGGRGKTGQTPLYRASRTRRRPRPE